MHSKAFVVIVILFFLQCRAFTQTLASQAALAKLQISVDNAENRVAASEKKIADADSIIDAGKKMIDEAKAETKIIDSESKTYEKEYSAKYKSVKKLTGSKDKTEAKKASTELRALETEHKKADNALVARMNAAYKKQTTGISIINRGKNAKISAQESLQVASKSLKAAQQKYDAAASPAKEKGTGKK